MTGLRSRRSLAGVHGYERPAGAPLNLADNTNRWGAAPAARELLRSAEALASAYPEAYADSLKAAVAAYLDVPVECVTTGCGSDGVLDAAIRAFGEPGVRVAIPEPTFPMAAAFARANALEPVLLPLDADYQPDPEAIAASGAGIVYLCSPNNPLGAECREDLVRAIARAVHGLVIVDEAYAEFAGHTLVPLVREGGNLLVTRTMSKAFGLAGLRVGYAVGAPEVVRQVERSRGPYTVSAPGIAASCATLRRDLGWMRDRVRDAITERDRLALALRQRGLNPQTSAANYLLVPVRNAEGIAAGMRARGVAVRAFRGLRAVSPALALTDGDALRITAGPRAEMDAALGALDHAVREVRCG